MSNGTTVGVPPNNRTFPSENETTSESPEGTSQLNISFYELEYWIECEAALSLLAVIALYVFICIVRYTIKKRTSTRDNSGKQGKRLYAMLVVASGFTVLRIASDHMVAFFSSESDDLCFATIAVSTVLYALGLLSVYVFLWMRQSIFYANPVLAKVLNKWVTFASWSTLVVMLLCAVCLTVLYNVPEVNGWEYQVTEDGCKGVLIGDEIVAAAATAFIVYFQVSLLALFLYPLLSRKTQKYRSAGSQKVHDNGTSRAQGSSISNTDDNLTDGDFSSSQNKAEKHRLAGKTRKEYPALSENESCNDTPTVQSESYRQSETMQNEQGRVPDGNAYVTRDKSRLKSVDQKRPSIFNAPRLFKARSIFYRRNPKKKSNVPENPVAKHTRIRTPSMDPHRSDSERVKDRRSSIGSLRKDRKKKQKRRTQQGRRMMAYLKKSFYMMMICVVTDVAATVFQAQVNVPEIVYLVMFDLNLLINVICIVMSFREWDIILFPMCARPSKNATSSSAGELQKASVRPDPEAAKRRAEILRSVRSKVMSTPSTSSGKPEAGSLSYDTPPYNKKLDTLGSEANSHANKQMALNGKT